MNKTMLSKRKIETLVSSAKASGKSKSVLSEELGISRDWFNVLLHRYNIDWWIEPQQPYVDERPLEVQFASRLLVSVRANAFKKNLNFNLCVEDLLPLPKVCPVFGTPLRYLLLKEKRGDVDIKNIPSIDRIDNKIGYIKGNVMVISFRANQLKRDASFLELSLVLKYMYDNGIHT